MDALDPGMDLRRLFALRLGYNTQDSVGYLIPAIDGFCDLDWAGASLPVADTTGSVFR